MKIQIENIVIQAIKDIDESKTLEQLNVIKTKYLGKKEGLITNLLKELRTVDSENRPIVGKQINDAKQKIELILDKTEGKINEEIILAKIKNEKIDVTLPGTKIKRGTLHPLTQMIQDIENYFMGLGFEIVEGPEVEEDKYNFEMMNLAKGHPARAMHDSFYITENLLLRTHTSPVQARIMEQRQGKPLAIIAPGKTYRRDEDDATHSHQFMQIEGLVIDEKIRFSHLKQTLLSLVKHLFGEDCDIRLRPSFFPFTEPSVEVDVRFVNKNGEDIYIEILGAGMVHPNVLSMGGYDPNKVSGFAFGLGVERLAMIKYQIDDIRNFYNNDLKFLNQFSRRINR